MTQNCRGMTQSCRGMTQNCRGMTQNCRGMTQNCRDMTQNCRGMTQNCRGMTQNCRGMTQNCRGMTQNCRVMTQSCRGMTQSCRDMTQDCRLETNTHSYCIASGLEMKEELRIGSRHVVHLHEVGSGDDGFQLSDRHASEFLKLLLAKGTRIPLHWFHRLHNRQCFSIETASYSVSAITLTALPLLYIHSSSLTLSTRADSSQYAFYFPSTSINTIRKLVALNYKNIHVMNYKHITCLIEYYIAILLILGKEFKTTT